MLKIHLLGHVYVTWNAQTVNVSSKAAAMLAYLAIEKRAHHREHLAELLWDHPRALRNLRVELARLKQLGLGLFPERQPMLALSCETDLDTLLREARHLSDAQVSAWLAGIRGTSLSGLDDLCSPAFQNWVDQQRCVMAEQLEEVLGEVWQRFQLPGQQLLRQQLQDKAKQLGLEMPEVAQSAAPTSDAVPVPSAYPEQQAELAKLLKLARDAPQLALLNGQSGAKHELIAAAASGSDWKCVQLQAGPYRRLVQGALLQQIARLLPAPLPDHMAALMVTTDDADADLLRASQFITQANLPLVVSVHGVRQVTPWLVNGLRFALDLRVPLLLIVSSSSPGVLRELRQGLGHTDWARLHELSLPPLGIRAVQQVLDGSPPRLPSRSPASVSASPSSGQAASGAPLPVPGSAELGGAASSGHHPPLREAYAARLAQHSDGWPLHLKLMLSAPAPPISPPYSQPDQVSQAVLAELPPLPESVLSGLARLSLVQDRIGPDVAARMLGEEAENVLDAALAHGLLTQASAAEEVEVTTLATLNDETERFLSFTSEHLREALKSRLSAKEIRVLSECLARSTLEGAPALSALYAERAQLHDLAAQAHERAVPPGRLNPSLTAQPCPAPARWVGAGRQEVRTGNGYRVALDGGFLEVLRKGRPGPCPSLSLRFPEQPEGHWQLVARLDVFGTFLPEHAPAHYALSVGTPGRPEAVYSTEPVLIDPGLHPEPHGLSTGLLPKGQWFKLCGHSPGGTLTLGTCARHLALTVASLTWNGRNLIPAERQFAYALD